MNDLEKRVKELEAWGAFLDGFSRGTEARFNEVEKKLLDLERDRDILSPAVAELQWVISEFIRLQTQKIPELETKIETLWKWANDTGAVSFASQSGRIQELEEKVESLTRTLDMWQEIMGIEVVITAQTHEGVCEKCDRVSRLNTGNICLGCFYEELGVGNV